MLFGCSNMLLVVTTSFSVCVELFCDKILLSFRYVWQMNLLWTLNRLCECIHSIVKMSTMGLEFHRWFKAILSLPIIQLMAVSIKKYFNEISGGFISCSLYAFLTKIKLLKYASLISYQNINRLQVSVE